MRRCGNSELHEPHGDCDGRTVNAPMVGQLTVAELRAALIGEQDGALVAVAIERDGITELTALAAPDPYRKKGTPVLTLFTWNRP